MAALVLGVVELMAKYTATRLTGLVEMIRRLASPQLEGRGGKYTRTPSPV
jgi:hypothetical protein